MTLNLCPEKHYGRIFSLRLPAKRTQSNPIPPPAPMFLVCDGVEGHRGGALASKIISENLPAIIDNACFCHLFFISRLYCGEAIMSNVQWGRENAGYDNRDRTAPGQPGLHNKNAGRNLCPSIHHSLRGPNASGPGLFPYRSRFSLS